ncbi:MAG: RNase adapter RapZ [Lachnospiraceae bacterium]|nr:RNase adapter RapZ [Lachnospiraceae bacterium]
MKLLILTGMSGSGKHSAFKILEDMGYHCVDNLPVALLKSFVELAAGNKEMKHVAVGIDIRNGSALSHLEEILDELENDGKTYDILFLDAEDSVLIRRYKETRRMPPLSGEGRIEDGLRAERKALQFLKEKADYIVDTSHLLTRDLTAELKRILVENSTYQSLNITVLSFGFKYGIPTDADLVFDVRFLPNPYYIPELKPLTGNDQAIVDYVMAADEAHQFLAKLSDLIGFLIPQYIREGKNQLVICFGCTGGKHRSVTMARQLYAKLAEDSQTYGLAIHHRDIDKDNKRENK